MTTACMQSAGTPPALPIQAARCPPTYPPTSTHTHTALPPADPQFVESKAFAGGAQGVAALSAALDLGAALALRHMDLDSLKDPKRPPVPAEAPDSQRHQAAAASRRASSLGACCAALPGCGGRRGRGSSDGSGKGAAGRGAGQRPAGGGPDAAALGRPD